MASGSVSAGSGDKRTDNGDGWLNAQRAIDESRKQRPEPGKQEGGKSLYEVLQQNKTAKQEAFEESLRLKNQFRTLDDDEVDFLDSVLESTRAKEEEVRKETAEQLDAFRKQREVAEKSLLDENLTANAGNNGSRMSPTEESWATSNRKRRRMKEKSDEVANKLRRKSSTAPDPFESNGLVGSTDINGGDVRSESMNLGRPVTDAENSKLNSVTAPEPSFAVPQSGTTELSLVAYSSDED